jgi:phage-related protein
MSGCPLREYPERPLGPEATVCHILHINARSGISSSVKPVIWMGGSREEIRRFPEAVQDSLGFELYRIQCGLEPRDWKPMPYRHRGQGNSRARRSRSFPDDLSRDAARRVYVLHCFQKKTRRTSRSDIELATKRFNAIAR